MSKERLEVTRGIKEGANGVDREYEDKNSKGIIKGFAVMSKGNVKDMRGWVIDDKTLDQIVSAGKAHKKLGLKSRFGHPNMSDTALGTFLGRAKNFVKDGDIVRADLYLSKTAYSTPKGDLASYVLDLAEKDPEAFGTSVCLGEYELEDQVITKEQKDEGVTDLAPLLRIKTLNSVDAVDSPAANNSMFGTFFNESVELSAKATEFLENLLSSPDALNKVTSFLERFKVNKEEKFNYKCEDCGAEVKPDKNLECPKCGGQMKRSVVQTARTQEPEQGNKPEKQEVDKMSIELKDVTLDQLKSERPELAAKLSEEAVSGERTRVLSIVKAGQKEFAGMGMESLTEKAIEEVQDLNTSLAAMRGKRLTDLEAEKNRVPGPDGDIPPKKDHFSRAKEYQEINKCTLSKALLDTADPR